MIPQIDRTLLGTVSGFVAERMGLHFPEERWPDLARGLTAAGSELGFEDADACARWLTTGEVSVRQIETLASFLTVGETYFFRDPASFEALEREILPPLIARRARNGRTLRLWSAGCCTGEEAYSIAITCLRTVPEIHDWRVSILATDINPKFLHKGSAGIYTDWSFRGSPGWIRDRYFSTTPDHRSTIDPAVRELVHFDYLNLAVDVYPSLHNHTNAMDVIFCRNVLMYFTPEHQRAVATALYNSLLEDGYLLVNPAEASSSLFPMFTMEERGGVMLYRKSSRPAPTKARPTHEYAPPPVADIPMIETPLPPAPTIRPPVPAVFPSPIIEDPLSLARSCADRGRLDEALSHCERAIAADRSSPDTYFLHATICTELGRTAEAIVALGKALYLDQDFILAHHALGGLYRWLGKEKESKRHLAVALRLLSARGKEEVLSGADGMTCGRLAESVRAMTEV